MKRRKRDAVEKGVEEFSKAAKLAAMKFFLTLLVGFLLSLCAADAQKLGYVLQAERLGGSREEVIEKLRASDRDVLVLDEFFTEDSPWTSVEIAALRAGRVGRRVIAYLSIGEAEDYRPYWQSNWSASAPSWLLGENPDWPGNYRVRYWRSEWQDLIVAALDRIVATGFDGVYLDIVDAFEGFERDPVTGEFQDDLENPETMQSYRKDMIAWVDKLADHARLTDPDFWVVPQNGVQLLTDAGFASTVDAVGVEDLFTNGNKLAKRGNTRFRLDFLQPFSESGKPVFVIEYPRQSELKESARKACKRKGFSLLLTRRALDRLGKAFDAPNAL